MSQTQAGTPATPANGGAGKPQAWVDFAHVKSQLSIERVPEHLGLVANLKPASSRPTTLDINRYIWNGWFGGFARGR
jgi:hypothetical protein